MGVGEMEHWGDGGLVLPQCPNAPSLQCSNRLDILEVQVMKHAIIGLMLLLLVTSVWAGTLRDDFEDGDMDEWDLSEVRPIWEMKDGELVITPQGFPVSFYAGEPTWGDYTVRVRTRIVKCRSNGTFESSVILVRRESLMHTYCFGLGDRGAAK